jgi:uncharacterized protein
MMNYRNNFCWMVTALALLVLLSACARTPAQHYYVLAQPTAAINPDSREGPRIGLGPIRLPEYLDRPQIVTRLSATQLNLSSTARWAEPLKESFARALFANLRQAAPAEIVAYPWKISDNVARQVSVEVLRFDQGTDGMLTLDARWTITNNTDQAVTEHASHIEIAVNGESGDYDAIVTAASAAVAALAREIALAL